MKTWTVVLEIHDHNNEPFLTTTQAIKSMVEDRLEGNLPPAMGFAIFECTEAPYGPQGVVLTETVKHYNRCLCRGSQRWHGCPIHGEIARAGRVQTAPKEGRK